MYGIQAWNTSLLLIIMFYSVVHIPGNIQCYKNINGITGCIISPPPHLLQWKIHQYEENMYRKKGGVTMENVSEKKDREIKGKWKGKGKGFKVCKTERE